jgi:hypothetical protein
MSQRTGELTLAFMALSIVLLVIATMLWYPGLDPWQRKYGIDTHAGYIPIVKGADGPLQRVLYGDPARVNREDGDLENTEYLKEREKYEARIRKLQELIEEKARAYAEDTREAENAEGGD